jgi:hypothetical protein
MLSLGGRSLPRSMLLSLLLLLLLLRTLSLSLSLLLRAAAAPSVQLRSGGARPRSWLAVPRGSLPLLPPPRLWCCSRPLLPPVPRLPVPSLRSRAGEQARRANSLLLPPLAPVRPPGCPLSVVRSCCCCSLCLLLLLFGSLDACCCLALVGDGTGGRGCLGFCAVGDPIGGLSLLLPWSCLMPGVTPPR